MRMGRKQTLDPHSIKQIGGRAGRYTQDGYVTAFKNYDLQHIRNSIGRREKKEQQGNEGETVEYSDDEAGESNKQEDVNQDQEPPKGKLDNETSTKVKFNAEQSLIKKACLFPSFSLIEKFANDLQLHEKVKNPLSKVI